MTGTSPFRLENWLDSLDAFVNIESVSSDLSRTVDIRRAGEWLRDQIVDVGGDAEIVDEFGSPLVVGEVQANRDPASAPTVLVYGHFDVQPAGAIGEWITPAFHATIRDEWVYGRGTADDKGHLLMLVEAVRQLLRARALPVNVRFACDGQEETLGDAVIKFLSADRGPAHACVIFDSPMLERDVPVFYVGTRGNVSYHLTVRTGVREMHSGNYGGAALNALHALMEMIAAVLPRDGALPAPLRKGVQPMADEEWVAVERLRPGRQALLSQGAKPADPEAAEHFYRRTWAEANLDVEGISGGSPREHRAAIPVVAEANLSIRLAPGQDADIIAASLERLLLDAAPEGTEVELKLVSSSPPAVIPVGSPVISAGQDAVEAVLGTRPLLVRAGGTLPVLGVLSQRDIPTIVTGFDLPDGNIHAVNERLLLRYVPLGIATARELFLRLGQI